MKKVFFLFILVAVTVPIFSLIVTSAELTSTYGISYQERQKSNYIEKNGYSFRYMGNGTWDVRQLNKTSSSNDSSSFIVVFFLVIAGIIIIIGVCIAIITTEVAKKSGMDEKSAKKVGASAGVLAGTAAAIGTALLMGKSGGIKKK